ncbi:MipA/OmpV family protein [Phenylobacterium deserti]|uniref:MipA/OmpV family protein n=1 Tax=Phenylobacterium deserti TaxID=1914756 RepID=A0A328ADV2_9CAUL|nr:MipA/OmpV family protein [Phenylobacterium deserti]RAK52677.1 MipA/OmpV family protein [Phenylobacterium deserti]
MRRPASRRNPGAKPHGAPPTATIEIEVPAWDSDGDRSRPNIRAFLLIAAAGGLSLPAAEASAQTSPADGAPQGVVAVGVGMAPDFDGADSVRAIPFAFGTVDLGGADFHLRGLQARADLASDSRLSFGPVVSGRLSRTDADGPVGQLSELDTAIEAGAFVGYQFGGDSAGQGSVLTELTLLHDVSGVHDGLLMTASASYAAVRRPDYVLSFDVQATWADADYATTYFGVSDVESVRSGLPAYSAGHGMRDLGLGVTAGYWFTPSLGVIGRAGAVYLVGDAADSPIVDAGSRWQPTAGVALAYRF